MHNIWELPDSIWLGCRNRSWYFQTGEDVVESSLTAIFKNQKTVLHPFSDRNYDQLLSTTTYQKTKFNIFFNDL